MAASGDVIQIATSPFLWMPVIPYESPQHEQRGGIVIKDKDLTIQGIGHDQPANVYTGYYHFPLKQDYMIWMENANVILKHIHLESPIYTSFATDYGINGGPLPSPIHIESGTLELFECDLTTLVECRGNLTLDYSTLRGYSWLSGYAYVRLTMPTPALHIYDTSNVMVRVKNSTVRVVEGKGYNNMVIENVSDSTLSLDNAAFYGGTYTVGYGSYPAYQYGSDAIRVSNCQNLDIYSQLGFFKGGDGYDAQGHRHGIIEGGGNGGSGIRFIQSRANLTLSIRNNFTGGDGGDGVSVEALSSGFQRPNVGKYFVIHGGNGGDGITLIDSHVQYRYAGEYVTYTYKWGMGGHGAMTNEVTAQSGAPGQPIHVNANSTWENIGITSLEDWLIYD